MSWSSWRPSPQGASCRSWAVKRTEPAASAPASRSARTASTAAAMPPFMSEAPLPVSRPLLDPRRHERQVDRVEMAVELERPARPAALEPDDHGRRRRVTAGRPLDA